MTTVIGYNGKMCSDSQATRGDFIDNTHTKKIFEVCGCLIGISGSVIGAYKFIEWFEKQVSFDQATDTFPYVLISPPEELVNKGFHCLVMYPDKKMYEYWGSNDFVEVTTEYAGVGSGMDYGLSAMDAGATLEEAVAVAIKRDVYSGGDVQVFEVEPPIDLTEDYLSDFDKDQLISFIQTGELPEEVATPSVVCLNSEVFCIDEEESGSNRICGSVGQEGVIEYDGNSYNTAIEFLSDTFATPREIALGLDIKFAHNISDKKLSIKIEQKFAEIVAELNK